MTPRSTPPADTQHPDPLLKRLDDALLDGPGGEAEAALIYAAREIEQVSPSDPSPSCLRGLADVLIAERQGGQDA